MTEKVFGFSDYKEYLKMRLGGDGKRTGLRKALAEHLNIQTAFVSQVLKTHVHFSLEQAYRINDFLDHSSPESHFFLLLVQKQRAGTTDLEAYFQKQIKVEREKYQQIQARLNEMNEVPAEFRSLYYSHWQYSALHMALSIPQLRTPEAIATHFGMTVAQVNEVLLSLLQAGLAKEVKGGYELGTHGIHLGHDVVDIRNHHTNWRLRAIDQLQRRNDEDLQYSVVYSCSRETAAKLKEAMLKLIKSNIETIGPSKEEVLMCNNIDFFEI